MLVLRKATTEKKSICLFIEVMDIYLHEDMSSLNYKQALATGLTK